jgi:hypothetical protein
MSGTYGGLWMLGTVVLLGLLGGVAARSQPRASLQRPPWSRTRSRPPRAASASSAAQGRRAPRRRIDRPEKTSPL